jgi:tetratricopeptide (TPR) repeat protein
MAHDVFISYASEDKALADAACATLEAKRIRCWIAPRDVTPGVGYAEAIVNAITEAKVMIVFLSEKANQSQQIKRELERAVNYGKAILPVRIEDVAPRGDLEFYLAGQHWLDALTPPLEAHLQKLAEAVLKLLGFVKPPPPPPPPPKLDKDEAGFQAMSRMTKADGHRGKGEWEEARRLYDEAAQLYEVAGDPVGQAKALHYCGVSLFPRDNPRGDWVEAHGYFIRAAKIRRELGDQAGLGDSLNWAGFAELPDKNVKGSWAEAARLFRESIEAAQAAGDRETLAVASLNLGYALHPDNNPGGNWAESAEAYGRSAKLREAAGHPGAGSTLLSWAECLIQRKASLMTREAQDIFRRAAAQARISGDLDTAAKAEKWLRPSDALVLKEKGDALKREGKFSQAAKSYFEAADEYGAQGDYLNQGYCLRLGAECLKPETNLSGSWEAAITVYEQSLEAYIKAKNQTGIGNAFFGWGMCLRPDKNIRGDWDKSADLFLKAAQAYAGSNEKRAEYDSLSQRAFCLHPERNPRRDWRAAAEAYGKAAEIGAALGDPAKQALNLSFVAFCLIQGDKSKMTKEVYALYKKAAQLFRQAGDEKNARVCEAWLH